MRERNEGVPTPEKIKEVEMGEHTLKPNATGGFDVVKKAGQYPDTEDRVVDTVDSPVPDVYMAYGNEKGRFPVGPTEKRFASGKFGNRSYDAKAHKIAIEFEPVQNAREIREGEVYGSYDQRNEDHAFWKGVAEREGVELSEEIKSIAKDSNFYN